MIRRSFYLLALVAMLAFAGFTAVGTHPAQAAVGDGDITIHVLAPDNTSKTFTFTQSGTGVTCDQTFALTDGDSHNGNCDTPGTFSVTESVPAGWDVTSISCSASSGSTFSRSVASASVSISLATAGSVDCTFQNEFVGTGANIVITKSAPGAGATLFPFSISGPDSSCATSFSLTNGASSAFSCAAGSYTVAESVPAGWVLRNIVCSGASFNYATQVGANAVSINTSFGGTVSCTFYNEPTTVVGAISISIPAAVTCGSTTSLSVAVLNTLGQPVVNGIPVTLTANPSGPISNVIFPTVNGGVVTSFHAPNYAGAVVVTASAGGVSRSVVVTVVCGAQPLAPIAPTQPPAPQPTAAPATPPTVIRVPNAGDGGLLDEATHGSALGISAGLALISALSLATMLAMRRRTSRG